MIAVEGDRCRCALDLVDDDLAQYPVILVTVASKQRHVAQTYIYPKGALVSRKTFGCGTHECALSTAPAALK